MHQSNEKPIYETDKLVDVYHMLLGNTLALNNGMIYMYLAIVSLVIFNAQQHQSGAHLTRKNKNKNIYWQLIDTVSSICMTRQRVQASTFWCTTIEAVNSTSLYS